MEPSTSRDDLGRPSQASPFGLDRSRRRQRLFKRAIIAGTLLTAIALVYAFPSGRHHLRVWAIHARQELARRLVGLEPNRAEIEAEWTLRRARGIEDVKRSLTAFYDSADGPMQELFGMAGMDPEHALIRYGRGEQAFVISPGVFEPDAGGRSYRLRPNTRSVWLRQITIRNGPFAMFQVVDTPKNREIATRAGAIVDEGSVQNTNSWGVRGPEPETTADVRGVVLGDSFMQAMFNGDEETPSHYLEAYLRDFWKLSVSVLNTGHIGYSPEQYYFSLVEYGARFRPQFVVVSLCPNDLGDGGAVMSGRAEWLEEATYWLDQIRLWCAARNVTWLVVGVPVYNQIETVRRDDLYPAILARAYHGPASRYCFPIEEFLDEHLRLASSSTKRSESLLYNRPIHDDHFSPLGAALWGRIVGRRLVGLFDQKPPTPSRAADTVETTIKATTGLEPRR